MSYNYNIPQPGDLLSQSQTDILANFTALNSILNINLGVLNLPVNATGPTTAANTIALYSKTNSSSVPALFWRQQSSGTEVDITSSVNTTTGWCRLPCGIIMKWGQSDITTGSSVTISLASGSGIPDITTPINVQVSAGIVDSSPEGSVYFSSYSGSTGNNSVTVYAWKPFSGTRTFKAYVLIMGV